MMKKYSKISMLAVLILTCFQVSLFSQDPTYNSPYSRFGIGDLTNSNLMTTRGMGNVGSSYYNGFTINPVNPASYSFLTLATYDVGINAEYSRISDSKVSENRWNGNLDYLAIAFPLRNYKNTVLDPVKRKFSYGMGFVLKPYSTVSYDVLTTESLPSGDIQRNFVGNGGTYNIQWGNSVKYKNIAFGLNLGYMFGKISNRQEISIVDDFTALVDNIANDYNIRGFNYEFGIMYELVLNEAATLENKNLRKRKLVFGLHGNPPIAFNTSGVFSHIGSRAISTIIDTIEYNPLLTGTGTLPAVIGGGVSYYIGTKFNIGLDVEYGGWANFSNSIRPDQTFTNSLKLGMGGQYTPDDRGFGTFLERVSYQYGAYFHQDPRLIQGETINNYGVTLGMGLPFFYQQKYSRLNVNFNLGQRGVGTLISENFVQMGLGINFNDDSWFIRRKYN